MRRPDEEPATDQGNRAAKRPGRRDRAARRMARRQASGGRVSCGRLHAWGCDPSDRPTHLVMPGLAPGISLRQASSRVRGPMVGRIPGTSPGRSGHDVAGGTAGLRGAISNGRRAGLRSGPDGETAPGGDRRGGGIKVDRAAGPERATARRAEWRVGKRAERAPAVEGNGRRRFRHIFWAGFAGIKWD